jgi:diacylglycerol kinase (ATP)
MQKVRVFLNHRASHGQDQKWEELIERHLFRSRLEFIHPSDLDELKAEIDRAIADQVDVVISVGGDGTFHTLIQRLAHQQTRFLVLPAGTANDLARELGMNKRLNRALECVRRDEWKAIDLITVNGSCLATNGGVGLVGDVAMKINTLRGQIPGFRSLMAGLKHQIYSLALGVEVLRHRTQYVPVRIQAKEFSAELETPLLMINNQPTIAGSFLIAPETRNDDGRFNVTIFTHKHFYDLVTALYRVRRQVPPANDPQIISFETDRVTIEHLAKGRPPLAFLGDGELLDHSSHFEIGIQPSILRVYSPTLERHAQGSPHLSAQPTDAMV